MDTANVLEGFDPLAAASQEVPFADDPAKPLVLNILNSYTGAFDVFSELIQNALDSTQSKVRSGVANYSPHIWLLIDMKNRKVRVVDNGIGMTQDEFKFCLRPNVTYKRGAGLRGNKGVGATYLAYGFSFIKLQSKRKDGQFAAMLIGGRKWAEDSSGSIPRPTLRAEQFDVPELSYEECGASFEVVLGDSPGERPRNLAWFGALNAEQWTAILRIKTPLGGVYLTTPKFKPQVTVTVIDPTGLKTEQHANNCDYFYPHEEVPGKVRSIKDIQKALHAIDGDANTKFSKLSNEYKKLDCMYEIWGKDELLADASDFSAALESEDDKIIVERHQVVIYASFLSSAKQWNVLNDNILNLRKGQRIMSGGLQLACDSMVQGEPFVIPLTSTIGYQANAHVVVHFTDGNPDMGRKVFQPELKSLAERLAVRAVTIFKRYLQHRKPDAGPPTILASKALHDWKRFQENYATTRQLNIQFEGRTIALLSEPQQEQDVIALFHELVGQGVLKGYHFYATSQHETYDSLYQLTYTEDEEVRFDKSKKRLGVSDRLIPTETEPKVLEYKYDFESLIDDFEQDTKIPEHISLVVCWTTSKRYKDRFFFKSLLIGDEGSERIHYGATHQAFSESSQDLRFEVIILKDLLSYLTSAAEEEARQRQFYRDD